MFHGSRGGYGLVVALCPATSLGQVEIVWTWPGVANVGPTACVCAGEVLLGTQVSGGPTPSFQPALLDFSVEEGIVTWAGGFLGDAGMGQPLVSMPTSLFKALCYTGFPAVSGTGSEHSVPFLLRPQRERNCPR